MRFLKLTAAIAAALVLSLPAGGQPAPSAQGAVFLADVYNLDSTSYVYPIFCTPLSGSTLGACNGPGRVERKKVATSGSSTTVTSVNTDAPFADVSVGDLLFISVPAQAGAVASVAQYVRYVSDKASSDSITVDSALTLPTAGVGFTWWKFAAGTATSAGWFDVGNASGVTIQLNIGQISVTGGIDYSLECGISPWPGVLATPFTYDTVASGNLTATGTTTIAVSEPYTVCRLGLKIGTNDNLDTVVNAASDKIDFVEDPDGTPVACAADIAAASYTGAGLAAAATAAMNTAGICAGATDPSDAYLVTFNEVTGKYTIAQDGTPGFATFDLPWATGANTATSAKTLLGFAADIADAATYTGVAVTHDIGAEAEQITIAVVRR